MDRPPVTVDVHTSESCSWEMARRAAHAGLTDHVAGYTGYVEQSARPLRRREVAKDCVVVIISFGDVIDVQLAGEPIAGRYTSFAVGMLDGFAVTEHAGRQAGVELQLGPLGAHRLLGVPPGELGRRVVAIDALGNRPLAELCERLASAPDWPTRFDLLDAELLRSAAAGPEPDAAVCWAWRQLVGAHGNVAVGGLADEIGWSRRHFVDRFRRQIGVTPKQAGRILRFQRAVRELTSYGAPGIGEVAARCGYADHSHLVRDFHDLAGCAPTALLGSRLPDGGGFAG